MYLISRPTPITPKEICNAAHNRPVTAIIRRMVSGAVPPCIIWMANAESTAAAGAQGAVISRFVPPRYEATRPNAVAPMMPASAPCAAKLVPSGEKMVTPNAIAEGSATSMAASPPQKSPASGLGWASAIALAIIIRTRNRVIVNAVQRDKARLIPTSEFGRGAAASPRLHPIGASLNDPVAICDFHAPLRIARKNQESNQLRMRTTINDE